MTDNELNQLLAKMLPEQIRMLGSALVWKESQSYEVKEVEDTELLHICWLIQEELIDSGNIEQWSNYLDLLDVGSSMRRWQCYAEALAKVKGLM